MALIYESLLAMDWNAKPYWENLVAFNSKMTERHKKQPTDWGAEEEGEIDRGSFNLSGNGGGGSGSELAHASSARSSISASTDSSSKGEIMKTSKSAFEVCHAFSKDFSEKSDLARSEIAEVSPPLEYPFGSGEPWISLKLGKRAYFENNSTLGDAKASSLSVVPASSTGSTTKKNKPFCHSTPPPRCQVEGCNLDLSSAKEYHRKHRVCETHSKWPKVVVGGLERRFCQQCSRFHSLSEFDEKKRSCRRRLSDHNARRRKPQQNAIQFNSTRLSSPFFDGKQQISFASNDASFFHTRSSENHEWENTWSGSKFTLSKGYLLKFEKTGGINGHLQLPGTDLMHAASAPCQNSSRPLPSKGSRAEVSTQGLKECPMLSSNPNTAPDIHRALSLLSTDSWGSEPANIVLDPPFHVDLTSSIPQPVMHGVPQGMPFASSEHWQAEHTTDLGRVHTLTASDSSHFEEIQLFKAPYENGLYSDLLN